MKLHQTTFEYLMPTGQQVAVMSICRNAVGDCAAILASHLPDGADKDHVMRLLRDAGMWANVAITREADGTPRK